MHDHAKCSHKLEYCKICDVVYCEKCNSEWRRNTYTITYQQSNSTGTYSNEYPVTYAISVGDLHQHAAE